jgi:hypothetical protein
MCLCFLFAPVCRYTFNALIWSGRRWLQTIHDTVGKLVVLSEIPLDPVNLDLNRHKSQTISRDETRLRQNSPAALQVSLRRLWWVIWCRRSSHCAALSLMRLESLTRLILSRWGFRCFVFNLDFLQDVQKHSSGTARNFCDCTWKELPLSPMLHKIGTLVVYARHVPYMIVQHHSELESPVQV